MADKKDEIIRMQLDLIRKMTEHNVRRISEDIWGATRGTSSGTGANGPSASPKGNGADARPEEPPVKASDSGDGGSVLEPDEEEIPREDIADLKKELDSYIGLGEVKREVLNLINMATVYKLREENDLPNPDMSLHLVFSGNPGTGKTMIARFMARVYHSLGLLSRGKLVEVDRSGLVAGYIGQTAIKTAKVLESAKGSVLFIDEAYTLTSKSENDFGYEAVDTILKAMEDNRDDLVVIVAGYIELMEEFINSNPGLRSRFNKYIDFADYSSEEMWDIFALNCKKSFYNLTPKAEIAIREYFAAAAEEAGEFGNARGVRNTFEKILTEQANRIAELDTITRETLMTITEEDVNAALYPGEEETCREDGGPEESPEENVPVPDDTEQEP